MFTGIVEVMGRVVAVEPRGELTRLEVEAPQIVEGLRVADALGALAVGSPVNLERALRADGRLDGHFVQGHVDGTGVVRALERHGDDVRLHVDCGPEVTDYLVEKGSVAVDGVSLTVVGVSATGFDVALIPHTLEVTTLGVRRPGERVNLEADVLGKYVKRQLDRMLPARGEGGAP